MTTLNRALHRTAPPPLGAYREQLIAVIYSLLPKPPGDIGRDGNTESGRQAAG